jgi:acyl-CoA synthetase (NDP forming)/RimJ/RimL family protein N-acetyltransferase
MAARAADVLLSDGATVHLRPIEPEDADQIVAMHARFSERTRYLRYFSPYPRIPERDLHRFTHVDHHDREAIVVAAGDRLIAVGRYDRLGPGSDEAEVAFVVEDAHQGRGIGSILLEHLAASAREDGLRRFVAEVLPTNGAMLRVFADAGFQVARQYEDGVVHLEFPIAPTEQSLAVQHRREQVTEAASITRLLRPRGVALYGVRRAGHGIGALLLNNLRDFAGELVVVHPDESTVDGVPAVPRLAGTGLPIDLAVVAVPAPAVAEVLQDAAAAGVSGVVVVSSGFAEAGPAGAAAQARLLATARAAALRLVGPNCLGVANTDPLVRLNATLAPELPGAGRVGFFCQSGALGVALLGEAKRRGLGLSTFVSAGNRADVSGNDLLQFWQGDPMTDAVLLYLETFGNPRKFARLVRRVGREKPVVAVASPYRPSFVGPASRPGADERGTAALFARSGVIRVQTVTELFDVGLLLAGQPLPAGDRVAIVTNSSALGVLAAGACAASGLTVAHGYPVDVGPQAGPQAFAAALSGAVADERTDALVVAFAPPLPSEQLPGDPEGFAAAVASTAGTGKPVVATSLGGALPPGVPGYPSVEEGVRALARVARYAAWRRTPTGTVPELSGVDEDAAAAAVARRASAPELLACYGIEVLREETVSGARAAVAAAGRLGYPVVLKIAEPRLRHRLDLGAVRLGLADAGDVRHARVELGKLFGREQKLIVQSQVPPGISCIVELTEDAAFGPVVGFGPGGVTGELLGDMAWRAAPLTDLDAQSLVREPQAAPLLFGHRGGTPVAVDALTDLLHRVAALGDAHPEVRRLRLNPVLARPDGLTVLHASLEYGPVTGRPDSGPRQLP